MIIWVKLMHFPFELLYWDFFKHVGYTLENFVEIDLSYESMGIMCVGKSLVDLDIREGLAEERMIKWGNRTYIQHLDYMGIPFKYNQCYIYGHVVA